MKISIGFEWNLNSKPFFLLNSNSFIKINDFYITMNACQELTPISCALKTQCKGIKLDLSSSRRLNISKLTQTGLGSPSTNFFIHNNFKHLLLSCLNLSVIFQWSVSKECVGIVSVSRKCKFHQQIDKNDEKSIDFFRC